jgi:hypothetical protein
LLTKLWELRKLVVVFNVLIIDLIFTSLSFKRELVYVSIKIFIVGCRKSCK